MMWLDPQRGPMYAKGLASYSLAIICFLVGVWWGLAVIRRRPWALIGSNAVVIVAFLGHAILPTSWFFLVSALLFSATLLVERRGVLFRPQPPYYARLRLCLTVVATVSLLVAWVQA